MERLADTVRGELSRFGAAGRDRPRRGRVAGRGRRADRAERLAGAHRARRDAAREHELVRVGVRAHATRSDDSREARRARSAEASLRAGAVAGAANDRRGRGRGERSRAVRRRPRPRRGIGRPRSATKSCGIWLRARPRRASRAAETAALSDTLSAARKAGICRAFSLWQKQLTQRRTSRSSKASTRSGNGRACTSARPVREASTTSSTRSSTTPSTRPSRVATTASR